MSLANMVRPATFGSAIGEAARINGGIIRNQIRTGKISHAYLFDGLRGSGKTTTARTLAKALNCLNLKDGEPCNCCANCRKIDEGSTPDVKEVDAARNNGVDYAKQLEEDTAYKPVELKKKVYILDECHCMTSEAFSSLLKLVETPPEWCVFIFCTTDPQKVPVTIRSRCQEYRFKAVSLKELSEHLQNIVKETGAKIEPAAADTIARHSEGSVRDAVVALETCLSEEADITEERVNEILGAESWEQVFMLIEALTDGNRRFLINCVDRWYSEGRKISDVLSDCLLAVTDRLRYLAGAEPEGAENYVGFVKNSKLGEGRAFVLADGLRETYEKMRYNPDRGILTVSLLKVSAQKENVSFANEEDILNRLTDAEKEIRELKAEIKQLSKGVPMNNQADVQTAAPAQTASTKPAVPELSPVNIPDMNEMFGGVFGFMPIQAETPIQNEGPAGTEMAEEVTGKRVETVSEESFVQSEMQTSDEEASFKDSSVTDIEGFYVNFTDDGVSAFEGFEDASEKEIPEGFEAVDEIPEIFGVSSTVSEPEPVAEESVNEPVADPVPDTSVGAAEEDTGEPVIVSGPSFSSLDALFSHINDNASEIQKLDWAINDDELWRVIASYCTREEADGKVIFKSDKKNVCEAFKKKLNEKGFTDIAEVIEVTA